LLLGLALSACGARSSVLQPEEGGPSDGAIEDRSREDGQPFPDARRDVPVDWAEDQGRDKHLWPDLTKPKDQWPWPTDNYQAIPFGCQSDADCFGQRCCATPWGVKLCAPECPEI
jgi:hypothetical protein